MDSPDSTTPTSSTPTSKPEAALEAKKKPVNEGLKTALTPAKKDNAASPDRPASPEPNCVICLEKVQNKSFADACFHQFCYDCILEWSKVKAECPLCKQPFKSIIHTVVSMEDYQQYWVPDPPSPSSDSDDDFMRSIRFYDWGGPGGGLIPNEGLPAATAFAQRLRDFRERSFLGFHNYYQPGSTASSGGPSSDIWRNFRSLRFPRLPSSGDRPYESALRRVFDPESTDDWHVCQSKSLVLFGWVIS